MNQPKTVVVSGPPCAGKSTHIDQNKGPNDLVIDLDRIAHALGYPTPHIDFDNDHPARSFAMIARASILKRLPVRDIPIVWIVSTKGEGGAFSEHVQLDPGPDICHQRATDTGRPPSTHHQIDQWYAQHVSSRQW